MKGNIMRYYKLTPPGIAAVKKWALQYDWNPDATVAEIDEILHNRSEGEGLEIELRGPNYRGWNDGLVWFSPEPHHVELMPENE
jgi:hypothetical protein